jgi:Thioredoxin
MLPPRDQMVGYLGALIVCLALGALMERYGLMPRIGRTPDPIYNYVVANAIEIPDAANLDGKRPGFVRVPQDAAASRGLIVFTDFECPFCARFDSVLSDGAFRVAYRHAPLSIHPGSREKHALVECVREMSGVGPAQALVGYYFRHQASAAKSVEEDGPPLGIPFSDAAECARGDGPAGELAASSLRSDSLFVAALGVASTPTFVIGKTMFSGAVSAEILERLWDEYSSPD